MNIAFVATEFNEAPEHWGGIASYLENITSILAERGHRVVVVTPAKCDQRRILPGGVELVRVDIPQQPWWLRKVRKLLGRRSRRPIAHLYQSWKLSRALVRIDARRRLDLVQFANFRSVGFFRGPRRPSVVRLSSLAHFLRQASSLSWNGTLSNRVVEPEAKAAGR